MAKKNLFFLLLIISILPLISLFHTGLPATHDGPDHVARIANFYLSLTEGNLIPRWAGNLNWGYGHPILMFLYPLPSYFASFFHVVGFSLVNSTKLVFGLTYIAGIVMFYVWASGEWNPLAGFVGAIIYGFSPYRFVDLYVRGDLGESVAFLFPPIIFWGLSRLSRKPRKFDWLIVSLGIFGLMTAHNAIALMVMPLVILYALYLGLYSAKSKKTFWVKALSAISSGFILSAFFWIPALFEGKYTLRNIVTRGDFSQRFVRFTQFFYSPWSYGTGNELSKELGILTWLALAGGTILYFRLKKVSEKIFITGSLLVSAASLWLMTAGSLFLWNKIVLLQNFQFPWRFLTVLVVVGAVLGSFVASKIDRHYLMPAAIVVVFITISSTFMMWFPKSYVYHPESYYSDIYNSTTDTGESSPIWSVRFMEHRPPTHMEVLSGSAEISEVSRTSTRHVYSIHTSVRTRILENTLYFPGWEVQVDGVKSPLEFQDPANRGLMTFWINSGQHKVVVKFTQTRLRLFADYLSLLGYGATIVFVSLTLWKKR